MTALTEPSRSSVAEPEAFEALSLFESDLAELDVLSGNGFDARLFEWELRFTGLGLTVERGYFELAAASSTGVVY